MWVVWVVRTTFYGTEYSCVGATGFSSFSSNAHTIQYHASSTSKNVLEYGADSFFKHCYCTLYRTTCLYLVTCIPQVLLLTNYAANCVSQRLVILCNTWPTFKLPSSHVLPGSTPFPNSHPDRASSPRGYAVRTVGLEYSYDPSCDEAQTIVAEQRFPFLS